MSKEITIDGVEYVLTPKSKPPSASSVSREWEIVECVDDNDEKWYPCDTAKYISPRNMKITSVKRLSDGEVFCIGDEVRYVGLGNTIRGFKVYTGAMCAQITPFTTEINAIAPINDIEKLPPNPSPSQPKKERITVSLNRYTQIDPRVKPLELIIHPSRGIAEWELPQIKAAIESVLNDDGVVEKYYNRALARVFPDRKYTQQDLEKCFESARMKKYYTPDGETEHKIVNQFPTFQDYLKSIRND